MGKLINFNIWLTNQCNLACEYCYEKEKGNLFLKENIIKQLVAFISSYLCEHQLSQCNIRFHGGEPTLNYNGMCNIMSLLSEMKDISFEYAITTNGVFENKKILQLLIEKFHTVSVSIDGDTPQKNNKRISRSGKNETDLVLKNIDYLIGRRQDIAIRMTVSPDNVENLYDSINGFVKRGYKTIYHALDIWSHKWTQEKFDAYYSQLEKIYIKYHERPDLYIGGAQKHEFLTRGRCEGGVSNITVFMDGTLYPCTAIAGKKEYCIGDIWEGVQKQWEKKLQSINDIEMKECKGCSLLEDCIANRCRFINKAVTGQFNQACDCICEMENIFYKIRKNL